MASTVICASRYTILACAQSTNGYLYGLLAKVFSTTLVLGDGMFPPTVRSLEELVARVHLLQTKEKASYNLTEILWCIFRYNTRS